VFISLVTGLFIKVIRRLHHLLTSSTEFDRSAYRGKAGEPAALNLNDGAGFPPTPDHSPGSHILFYPNDPVTGIQKDHVDGEAHKTGVDGAAGTQEQALTVLKAGTPHQSNSTFPKGVGNDQVGNQRQLIVE
jgi:hypothetical protein